MRLDARGQRPYRGQVLKVERIGAADGQRDSVHHQREALADALQVVERLAAGHVIILGDDLEPVDVVRFGEDGLVVRSSQAETKTG